MLNLENLECSAWVETAADVTHLVTSNYHFIIIISEYNICHCLQKWPIIITAIIIIMIIIIIGSSGGSNFQRATDILGVFASSTHSHWSQKKSQALNIECSTVFIIYAVYLLSGAGQLVHHYKHLLSADTEP